MTVYRSSNNLRTYNVVMYVYTAYGTAITFQGRANGLVLPSPLKGAHDPPPYLVPETACFRTGKNR